MFCGCYQAGRSFLHVVGPGWESSLPSEERLVTPESCSLCHVYKYYQTIVTYQLLRQYFIHEWIIIKMSDSQKKFIPKCNVLSSDLYISNKWPDRFDWTRHSTWNVQSFWFLFREDVYCYWCPLLGDHLSVEDGGGPDGQVWGWWGKVWAQQAETSKIT